MTSRHRAARPPRTARAALAALLLALAVALAVVIDHRRDHPPTAPAAAPVEAVGEPLHNQFAEHARAAVPTLDLALGNEQIAARAQSVCNALARQPVAEVYATHDLPVETAQDATRFLSLAVVWRCPEYAGDLSTLLATAP